MSQFNPPLDNLLATVRGFLESCAPLLEGEARYHAQVAGYLLGICEREGRLGPAFDAQERRLLAGLLGHDGPTSELNVELAAALRAGRWDDDLSRVLDVLLAVGINRVAVVRPDQLDPSHRPTVTNES
jgi:hypothetical protein